MYKGEMDIEPQGLKKRMPLLLRVSVKIINVWDRVIGYMTWHSDMTALMKRALWRTSSWTSLQQADAQTAANETESKMQMVNTIIFIKSIRQTYLSSADDALSPIAVFDLEMSW